MPSNAEGAPHEFARGWFADSAHGQLIIENNNGLHNFTTTALKEWRRRKVEEVRTIWNEWIDLAGGEFD
ncbi:hypothetical protein OESDEN_09372, partial [Oesophagostomum dentatum]